jgi:4-coumarate--CoA ligase (photoactive yellow protein activation family)
MIPSRQGIYRMLSSLAQSLRQTTSPADMQSLTTQAAVLFGLDRLATDAAPPEGPCNHKRLAILASAIEDSWTGERLVFSTSGSTGVPKQCIKEVDWLVQETRFLAELFQAGRRVVGLVPAHHIYGFLFTVLLPELLQVPIVDLDAMSLGALTRLLRSGDILVGFPFLWKKCGEIRTTYPAGITGVTSTGPCPPEVIARAMEGGLARMAEIHGSTETGGLGYRFDPSEPFRLMDHWLPPAANGALQRVHPLGKEPVSFSLPDVLAWDDARHYRPSGRKDNAVQVAGINVYPDRIRQVLMQHPLVADAAVRPMGPEEGDRLKAFIVTTEPIASRKSFCRELREYAARILSTPEIPRSFTIGPTIPRNRLGKDADWDAADSAPSSKRTP